MGSRTAGAEQPDQRARSVQHSLASGPGCEVLGEPFLRRLDESGQRIKLPVDVAAALGPSVVVMLALRSESIRYLALIPLPRWREIISAMLARSTDDPAPEKHRRALASQAARADISDDGRITLPKRLVRACGIDRAVTCWPQLDRLAVTSGQEPTVSVWDDPEQFAETCQLVGGVTGLL